MSRAVLCLPTLDHGDAISHFATLFARALSGMGHRAEILASIVHPKMRAHGRRADRLPTDLGPDDRIILVHSISSPWAAQLDPPPAPTLLLYTGLTPPEMMEPFAAHLAPPLRQAREQLRSLAPHLSGAICTSRTAVEELAAITGGSVKTHVVPLVIDESLYPIEACDPAKPVGHPPRILMVSRALPHKRFEDAIAVHACVQRTFNPDVALDIVGDSRLCPEYVSYLKGLSGQTEIVPPKWRGKVTFSDLKERFRAADLLLCTSAHEGFGVPLLEAMWMGVPIVATHCPGTAETLGGAGLIARERHIPALAEMVEMVLTDLELRGRLISAGRKRAGEFACATLTDSLGAVWDDLER